MGMFVRSLRWMAPAAIACCAGMAQGVTVGLVAKVGDDFGGRTVTGLGQPFTNGLGHVGFVMLMSDSTRSIYYQGEVFNSSAVPGLSGSEDTMGISNAGGWAYSPSFNSNDAVYSSAGLVVADGDPHPAIPGQFSTFGSRVRMSDDGSVWWVGGSTGTQGGTTNNRALLRCPNPANPASTVVVEQGGQVVSGLTLSSSASSFAYDMSGNSNHYIRSNTFVGVPTTSDTGIVVNGAVVAREGDPTGQGDNWQNWRFVGINNSGNYTICGDTNSATDDFMTFNNTIVARQGDSVAGVTLGTTVDMVSINNLNQLAAIWDITSGADEGLFFGDGATFGSSAQLLLRVGDPLDINFDNVPDFTLTDFNASSTIGPGLDISDHSTIYVNVDITPIGGGAAVEVIIGVQIPAPSGVGLLAVACLGALRRRR